MMGYKIVYNPSGGGAGGPTVIYDTPENHGAKGDGTTDDSAAINAAIANVVAKGQADGSNYGEVWFASGKIYQLTSSPTPNAAQPYGGTSQGNAQIALPNLTRSVQKFTLALRGVKDASAVWSTGFVMTGRATIRSTMAANPNTFATYGSASVIGGPTAQQIGQSTSSNLCVVLDGLTVINPANNAVGAIDLRNVAEVKIGTLNLNASVNPATFSTAPSGGGFGLAMPTYFNEDNSEIERLAIIGHGYGLIPGEHTNCRSAVIFYCQYAVAPQSQVAHACRFGYLSTEGCTYHISSSLTGAACRLHIDLWDTEDVTIATTYHLDDAANLLRGEADFHNYTTRTPNWGNTPIVNGGANFKIINGSQARGVVTPPAVPAASTNFTNPFWRDAFVQVAGGTGVAVTVDGQSFPATAPIPVRSGGVIRLGAYTVAPTWTWYLV